MSVARSIAARCRWSANAADGAQSVFRYGSAHAEKCSLEAIGISLGKISIEMTCVLSERP